MKGDGDEVEPSSMVENRLVAEIDHELRTMFGNQGFQDLSGLAHRHRDRQFWRLGRLFGASKEEGSHHVEALCAQRVDGTFHDWWVVLSIDEHQGSCHRASLPNQPAVRRGQSRISLLSVIS